MYELQREDEWQTVWDWSPGTLDDDLRDESDAALAGLDLFENCLESSESKNLIRFCREWRVNWQDQGPSDRRDEWFDEFRQGGSLETYFGIDLAPKGGADGHGHGNLSDDAGRGLYRVALDQLAGRYGAFGQAVAGWRRQLEAGGWGADPSGAGAAEPGAAGPSGELPDAMLRLRLGTPQDSVGRMTDFPTLGEFSTAFRAAGLSSWFDIDAALTAAVREGKPQLRNTDGILCDVTYQPDSNMVEMSVDLQTEPPADNTAVLTSLRKGDDRCFYLQYQDVVVMSGNGSFADTPKMKMVQIATNRAADFALPGGNGDVGQVIRRFRVGRHRDYFTVHPGTHSATSSDTARIEAAINEAHPGRQVQVV